MPPASRNHRDPTGWDTPPSRAASSLERPAAIADKYRRLSSRFATGGRPGDRIGALNVLSEPRFRFAIAPSVIEALRRPAETAQYTSLAFGARCHAACVRPSTGSAGDAYDNAMCESFFATLEYELTDRHRFVSRAEAQIAIFRFIERFYNPSSRHSSIGYMSPAKFEAVHQPAHVHTVMT